MNIDVLRGHMIFRDMTDGEIREALSALDGRVRRYEKGQVILRAGDCTAGMGLVLSGRVTIEREDARGSRTILNIFGPKQCFAETYAFLYGEMMMVSAVADEDCEVLFVSVGKLREICPGGPDWAVRMLLNLMTVSSHKNISVSERGFHTAPRTIRERVLSYLRSAALRTGSTELEIPYDRQQLADYLNVERSALSKELGKMRRDGLIRARKNRFVLLGSGEDRE